MLALSTELFWSEQQENSETNADEIWHLHYIGCSKSNTTFKSRKPSHSVEIPVTLFKSMMHILFRTSYFFSITLQFVSGEFILVSDVHLSIQLLFHHLACHFGNHSSSEHFIRVCCCPIDYHMILQCFQRCLLALTFTDIY